MNQTLEHALESIYDTDPRYKKGAYVFVMEALSHTQKKFKRSKHVTGQELLEGIKDLLMEKFGPMALFVLKSWGIKTTEDFGHIVFNLVNSKVLSKTEEDDFEHFCNGYDFYQTFEVAYRKKLHRRLSRMKNI